MCDTAVRKRPPIPPRVASPGADPDDADLTKEGDDANGYSM